VIKKVERERDIQLFPPRVDCSLESRIDILLLLLLDKGRLEARACARVHVHVFIHNMTQFTMDLIR
jgi:hypothetical protein